jgi:antitoxin component YwqK of YwqJK toxin-antitoxin module
MKKGGRVDGKFEFKIKRKWDKIISKYKVSSAVIQEYKYKTGKGTCEII